ncbi:hypothetical protein TNCV_1444321 [Trichonephila clavipes]|nr:hypothetical protein TNCV_1444321 [Trichonephila clavipes]
MLGVGKGHHKDSDLHIIHDRKSLHSALCSVFLKSFEGNKPALPQSFELASPTEEYGTSYEHRADRYATYLRIYINKCMSS